MPARISQMNEFLVNLDRANIHPDSRKQAAERVKPLIDEFEQRPENRIKGGRAVKKAPRKLVLKTLRHLISAAKEAKHGNRDSVSREARKFLRAIRTVEDFDALAEKAKDFCGYRWKERHRQNLRKIEEKAPRITIGTSLVLRQLVTVDDLMSVSKRLRLCAHDPAMGYLDDLKDGSQEFWSAERNDDPIALIAVDRNEAEVREANGFDHEPIGLSQHVMLEVLRSLRASADDYEEFSSVGAYSLFLTDPVPEPRIIQFDNSIYKVWGRSGEVVINRDEDHWSQFRWDVEGSGWTTGSYNDMESGRLADLLSCCPSLAEAVREHRRPQASEPCPANRRPRRRRRRGRG